MTFGERLKAERLAAGLTQETLSGLCGISQRTWSDYENGISKPQQERLISIADTLGVSADYLLCRTDEKNLIVA